MPLVHRSCLSRESSDVARSGFKCCLQYYFLGGRLRLSLSLMPPPRISALVSSGLTRPSGRLSPCGGKEAPASRSHCVAHGVEGKGENHRQPSPVPVTTKVSSFRHISVCRTDRIMKNKQCDYTKRCRKTFGEIRQLMIKFFRKPKTGDILGLLNVVY